VAQQPDLARVPNTQMCYKQRQSLHPLLVLLWLEGSATALPTGLVKPATTHLIALNKAKVQYVSGAAHCAFCLEIPMFEANISRLKFDFWGMQARWALMKLIN
jgi:hypothetical protein